jgi:TIR domain
MPEPENPSHSRAEAALFAALREIHRRAGEPSTRKVAQGAGGISHTTVAAVLRGTTVPTWPVLEKIVKYLDGDIELFRQLWADTRDRPEARSPYSGKEISVFVSYARIDDRATYNRISQVIDGFANIYESLTGQPVGVFKDVESIKPGDDWRDRIRLGLSASSIFLAFISPAYLRSTACREELSEFFAFLDANASTRLIVPLIFASPDRILNDFGEDELWLRLAKLQWLDISALRQADPGSSQWVSAVSVIADRTDEVLRSFESDEGEPPTESPQLSDKKSVPKLERMATIEGTLPSSVNRLQRFGVLMQELASAVGASGPEMQKADTFAKKLAVSERLAAELDSTASEMDHVSERLAGDFEDLTYVVNYALDAVRRDPDNVDQQTALLLRTMEETARNGVRALSQLDGFTNSIGQIIGFSSRLDEPLKIILRSCLRIADLRGILSGWQEEIAAADTRYPRASLLTDSRRAYARRIFIWEERLDHDPRVSQAQRTADKAGGAVVIAHVRNASDWPIYDVRISWHKGTAPWDQPDLYQSLMPGDELSTTRALPDLPAYVNPEVYGAVAFFRDANGVTWRARPNGVLDEIPPGQEPPHTW